MSEIRADIVENQDTDLEDYGVLAPEIAAKLEWFRDQKIGVIFHWGLYSLAGIVESWQLSEADTWARENQPPFRSDLATLRKDYWGLNQDFNPTKFDPDDWAKACKAAGFKYMIFTTKHHDGFNMYDTAYSDYKVTHSPVPFAKDPRRDIFGHVVEAFRKADLGIGAYYSKADWHCPDYWVKGQHAKGRQASYSPVQEPERWQKFQDFVFGQLKEITHNYGHLDILWLDAGWVNMREELLDMPQIVASMRAEQPDMLVVDRSIGGAFEDYVTPERKIPDRAPIKAWESNIPLADNWGYVPNDRYKPFSDILTSILKIVSKGGNVILGVGPKPDGTLPQEALAIMQPLGEFLSRFGEGIYGTRPAKITQVAEWYLTESADAVYAFQYQEGSAPIFSLGSLREHYQFKAAYDMSHDQAFDMTTSYQLPKVSDHCYVVKLVKE